MLRLPRIHVEGLDGGNVHAEGSVAPGAAQADECAVVHRGPVRIRREAVEAHTARNPDTL